MKIELPDLCLVLLIGASGSGKSTFARQHFKSTEIVSSDFCRGIISDDENDQSCSAQAFALLHYIVDKRLAAGRLTVVDATNVQPDDRKALLRLAKENDCLGAAIVLNMPENVCHERNASRPDRDFGPHVVRRHRTLLKKSLRFLKEEGFRYVYVLNSPEEAAAASVVRTPLWNNRKDEKGPFDIIGDIHGCYDELLELLYKLGYVVGADSLSHPQGRRLIFLGDLVDRGPKVPDVLRLCMTAVQSGAGFCVPGNHDVKLVKKLKGRDVRITHGLAETLAQLESESEEFKQSVSTFIDKLVSHLVLDDGRLVVAHAGLKEAYQGRSSGRVREFCLYGETTGETDAYGLPVRYNWALDYRGKATVVYGHTPVEEPSWLNRTICVDTGCVFGGKLTALRYPESEVVSVPARAVYYEPSKPFLTPKGEDGASLAQPAGATEGSALSDEGLNIDDVLGKRVVATRLAGNVTVREENARAALEVMSRFALHPRWLVYLPPTMSPSETSKQEGFLERPEEALAYYRGNGVSQVVLEEKHMGSRAVVIVGRDEAAIARRFGLSGGAATGATGSAIGGAGGVDGDGEGRLGVIYTRTGRAFFADDSQSRALERQLLQRVSKALTEAKLFDHYQSDWLILDCELMPWSQKAQALLKEQYAAVGACADMVLGERTQLLSAALVNGLPVENLLAIEKDKHSNALKFVDSYRNYCWPVTQLSDLKLAPFQIIASEGVCHMGVDHLSQMETLARLSAIDPEVFRATAYELVDTDSEDGIAKAAAFFEKITATGEGMVVKPLAAIVRGPKGYVQPAVKCRGREYLRIIYGSDYTRPENLERLRSRGLGAKRSLAGREFALGLEAVERFVRREPLYRVHECVFSLLALESEPVDPRL